MRLDHVIGSDLLSESNKLCKHSEPRCGEDAKQNCRESAQSKGLLNLLQTYLITSIKDRKEDKNIYLFMNEIMHDTCCNSHTEVLFSSTRLFALQDDNSFSSLAVPGQMSLDTCHNNIHSITSEKNMASKGHCQEIFKTTRRGLMD